jgi:hypothetical protein
VRGSEIKKRKEKEKEREKERRISGWNIIINNKYEKGN